MKINQNTRATGPAPQVVSVGDATADIFYGLNLSREARYGKGGRRVSVLHVKDIQDGLIAPRSELNVFELSRDSQVDRYFLRIGDVVVTARGSILKSALVDEEHVGMVPSSNLIVVRAAGGLRAELVLALLRDETTRAEFLEPTAGTAVPALGVKALSRLQLRVPEREGQETLAQMMKDGETRFAAAVKAARRHRERVHQTVMNILRLIRL